MLKFTNSKALTLSAMLVLGTASAFGQTFTLPTPAVGDSVWYSPTDAKAKFPILYSNVAATPAVYTNLPGNSVNKGVYYRVFNETNTNVYRPVLATQKPNGNDTKTTVWAEGNKLGVFLGDKQAGDVLINLSTKYLKDVKNFSLKLSSDNLGKVATSTANWYLKISVLDLEGKLVKKDVVLKGGSTTEDAVFVSEGAVFSTKDDLSKVVNLFRAVKDPITDETRFNETGLSNKFIQVELYSDPVAIVEVEGTMSHFAPALVISDFKMDFVEPTIALTADNFLLKAGKGFTSCETGKLALTASNIQFEDGKKVEDVFTLTTPNTDVITTNFLTPVLNQEDGIYEVEGTYNFQPTVMQNRSAAFSINVKEEKSPIRLEAVKTDVVVTNSEPKLTFAPDHIYFGKIVDSKVITVSGENIPNEGNDAYRGLVFTAYEKKTSDQGSKTYGNVTLTPDFKISDCGAILDGGKMTATLNESVNDITRPEVWTVEVDRTYKNKDALAKYDNVLGIAGVGALWLTYDGKNFDGTTAKYEADNVFFSPYDPNDDLAGDRYRSRVKTFMLHASELNPTEIDGRTAKVTISMGKVDTNDNNTDNQEFRFRTSESDPWINANTGNIVLSFDTWDAVAMKKLAEEGQTIYVEFIPNKDGFKQPSTATEEVIWKADTYELKAVTTVSNVDIATVAAGLFGDTRANLWSNINKMGTVVGMHNSWTEQLGYPALVYPEFRKNFGKEYLGTDCGSVNPYNVDSFYVAGYNLEENVAITKAVKSKYEKAFTYKIVNKLTGAEVTDGKLVPNKYGEVLAMVYVTFAPEAKEAGIDKAEDWFTIKSGENVILTGGDLAPDDAELPEDETHSEVSSDFTYGGYSQTADVFGFVYKPTIDVEFDTDPITAFAEGKTEVKVTVNGKEFNPMKQDAVKLSLTGKNTPFTLKGITAPKVNGSGQFTATATLVYAPTVANLCEKSNALLVEAPCLTGETVIEGTPYWNGNAPELAAMNYGDIDGHTAILKWKPVAGAEYYKVKVGHMVPKNTSDNVFISEVRASEGDQSLAVELFNGTASVINPKMLVNYYLKITRTSADGNEVFYGHFTNTDINLISEKQGWKNEALIVKDFVKEKSYDAVINNATTPVEIVINKNYKYTIQLMDGENQIDIFLFDAAGAHLSRVSVADLKENKENFNISDWETQNTSLKNAEGQAYYIWQEPDNFVLSVEGDGAESNAIIPAGNTEGKYITTKVFNLKKGSLYDVMVTAYNKCLTNEDGDLMSSVNAYEKDFIKTSIAGEAPTGDVSFEFNGSATGNDPISANAFKVVSGKSSVTIYNAAGKKAVVRNILGQPIAETVISSDNATIAAPAGIVTVAVEGETTVKAIVK